MAPATNGRTTTPRAISDCPRDVHDEQAAALDAANEYGFREVRASADGRSAASVGRYSGIGRDLPFRNSGKILRFGWTRREGNDSRRSGAGWNRGTHTAHVHGGASVLSILIGRMQMRRKRQQPQTQRSGEHAAQAALPYPAQLKWS
jgi:hypothetical protein